MARVVVGTEEYRFSSGSDTVLLIAQWAWDTRTGIGVSWRTIAEHVCALVQDRPHAECVKMRYEMEPIVQSLVALCKMGGER